MCSSKDPFKETDFDGDLQNPMGLLPGSYWNCHFRNGAKWQDIQRQLPTESAKFKTVDKLGDLS